MRRRLWLGLVGAGGVVAAGALTWSLWPKPTPSPTDGSPIRVHFSDLPRYVYHKGEYRGKTVRVAFDRKPVATADPLVFHFHPGTPIEVAPPTYRLHFDAAPEFTYPPPIIITGTVEGIAIDTLRRTTDVPGVVVLRGCRVVPLTEP